MCVHPYPAKQLELTGPDGRRCHEARQPAGRTQKHADTENLGRPTAKFAIEIDRVAG